MTQWDAIGVGLVVRDFFVLMDRYPASDEKLPAREIKETGGGPVPTALVTMARFGRKTAIAGVVGNDIGGRFLVDDLERENINTDAVAVRDGFESQTSVIVVENGRRTILEAPLGVGFPLTWDDVRTLPFEDSGALLLDARKVDVQLQAAARVREAGGLVVLDCGHPRDGVDDLVALSDVVIFSHTYPSALFGPDYDVDDFVRQTVDKLPASGPAIAGVTLGAEGCALAGRDEPFFRLPGVAVEAMDTTGAGDVFHGAFTHAFLKTKSVRDAARFANLTAARKCEGMTGRAPLPPEKDLWAKL
ncbi:MAG: sugar kinase [Acidobacteriota bacterium]|nr:MAG: sugar kinase [Acidobacteriota bacterium]